MKEQNKTKEDKPDEIDRMLASLLFQMPSITDKELGKRLGLSRQTVNKRRNSPFVFTLIEKQFEYTNEDIRRLLGCRILNKI